jgi:hypothetical protein
MADSSEQLTWRGVGRQAFEHGLDRAEPDEQVVAVIAIPKDRVEPRQMRGVALDHRPTAVQGSPHRCGVDDGIDDGLPSE